MDELLSLISDNPIDRFAERFGPGHGHLEMAYHAALPLALTPDLLYLIWANFRQDAHGKPLNMQWVTVADLILSPLCREIRHETYVMETAVRQELLDRMAKDERFGPEYILRLGQFIQHYASQYIQSNIPSLRQYAQAQQWAAQAYTEPDRLIESLASQYSQPPSEAETMRLAELLNTFSEPLNLDWVPTSVETAVNYDRLHTFGDSLAKFARGDRQTATRQLSRLLGPARELTVGTQSLPIPSRVAQALANQEEKIYAYRVTVQDETAVLATQFDHHNQMLGSQTGRLTVPNNELSVDIPDTRAIDRTRFQNLLVDNFSVAEIDELLEALNLEGALLEPGNTPRQIHELISHLRRRNRLDDLLQLCVQKKPSIDWSSLIENYVPPTGSEFFELVRLVESGRADAGQIRRLGQTLFDILFDANLRVDFLTFYERAIAESAFIRVELEMDQRSNQELALLPWELLCLPDDTGFGTDWLAAAPEIVLVRRPFTNDPSTPQTLLSHDKPIRIALVVGPNYPFDALRLEPHYQRLAQNHPGQFEFLPTLENPTAESLDNLLAQQPDIVHFLAHARQVNLNSADEGQLLLLVEEFADDMWKSGHTLLEMFSRHYPALVILQSSVDAQPEALRGLQALATTVSQSKIPTVVSWGLPLQPVFDRTVARFIHTVLPAFAQGIPLDEAIQNGRRALLREEDPLAFAAPSLFAHAAVRRRTASEPIPPILEASLGVAFAGQEIMPMLEKGVSLPATSQPLTIQGVSAFFHQGLGYLKVQLFQGELTAYFTARLLGETLIDEEELYQENIIELSTVVTVDTDGNVTATISHESGFVRELVATLAEVNTPAPPSIINFAKFIQETLQQIPEYLRLSHLTFISNWLNNPNSERIFIIAGGRANGKTVLAALLAEYFSGERQPPNNLYALAPRSTSAVYFCLRDRPETLDPRSFALTIASQWASRDSHFAYLQSTIDNHESYELDELVEQLLIRPFTDIDELIYPASIVFLVDDLEAALQHPGETTIVDVILRMLREVHGVRFLLTAQMQPEVRRKLADVEKLIYELPPTFRAIFNFAPTINAMPNALPGFSELLLEIESWLTNPEAPQHGGIFPEPYCGKSAAAANLIKLSQGSWAVPPELTTRLTAVRPGFIAAYHFYQSTDPRTKNPRHFIQSVAAQLANRFPAYNEAVRETIERWQKQQTAQKVQTSFRLDDDLPGENHPYLSAVNQMSVVEAFDRLIVQPWMNFEQAEPILILVDGLEDMLTYEGATTIPALLAQASLPSFLRFFLAANEDPTINSIFSNMPIKNFFWQQFVEQQQTGTPPLSSEFVADFTLPDESAVRPEQLFTKTWRLRNRGANWSDGFSLAFVEGVPMTATLSQPVPNTPPGEEVNISISLTAPAQAGHHLSVWQLRTADGIFFGDHVWVKIVVDENVPAAGETAVSDYDHFDIWVGESDENGRYPVTAESVENTSWTGQVKWQRLDTVLGDSTQTVSLLKNLSANVNETAQLGHRLFEFLFPEEVRHLYEQVKQDIEKRPERGLRVRVKLVNNDLHRLPWELCHDGRSYIFNNPDQPILLQRTIGVENVQAPPLLPRPVRLLVAIAAPVDQGRADVALQEKVIHLATEEVVTSSELDVQIIRHATLRNLESAMQSYQPHIVQFIGHSRGEKEGVLILENESGRSNLIPVPELTRLLAAAPVQCVILSPIGVGENSLTQLAPQFIQQGIPTVLAEQFVLPDQPAVEFWRTFYHTLLFDRLSFEEGVWNGRNHLATAYREPFWGFISSFATQEMIQVLGTNNDAEQHEDDEVRKQLINLISDNVSANNLHNIYNTLQLEYDSSSIGTVHDQANKLVELLAGQDRLSELLRPLQRLSDAIATREYLEEIINVTEKILGPDHPDTALSLNNLGSLLQGIGDLAAARPYFERALAIREKALGPDHPDTALSLNNLGLLLKDMGDLAAARPFFERALAITEKNLGPDHPDTASSLNNLGALLQAMDDLPAARPYFERALAIREKALGPDHPDTAISLNNLGTFYLLQGKLIRAQAYLERALKIIEQTKGKNHPDLVKILTNLGGIMVNLRKDVIARHYLKRAQTICREAPVPYAECQEAEELWKQIPGMVGKTKGKNKKRRR